MELLVDLFGYLSIVVHGLTILSQSVALGGVLFLVFLARPLRHPVIAAGTARIAGYAAIALLLSEAATVALQAAVLADTADLSLREVLTADFALAGLVARDPEGRLGKVRLDAKLYRQAEQVLDPRPREGDLQERQQRGPRRGVGDEVFDLAGDGVAGDDQPVGAVGGPSVAGQVDLGGPGLPGRDFLPCGAAPPS